MSVLIFLLVLFVLVLVHELGHFIAAKKTGMRVDEFGIGFPPKLFGVRKGETEYTFNALPIGGFVKIFGEDAVDAEGASNRERSFVAKGRLQQAIVLIAGVTMNVVFAWLLFTTALSVGVLGEVTEATASDDASLVITAVLPEGPAAVAGILPGTVVTAAMAGETVLDTLTPSSFTAFTTEHGSEELMLMVRKSGEESVIPLVPASGVIESEPERQAIGVALSLIDIVREPIHIAVYEGFLMTVRGLRDITVGLGSLAADALRGEADFSQVAGPVGIVGLVGEASQFGITSLLMFTAFISLNLAIINLLPFPALDGGRLVFVGIEAVTRRTIAPVWVARINAVGFMLLLVLMVAVTWNDIARIL